MTDDPLSRPILAARLTLADGTLLEAAWSMRDLDAGARAPAIDLLRQRADGPPEWLDVRSVDWPNPQDPVTLTGTVRLGADDAARAWLGLEKPA